MPAERAALDIGRKLREAREKRGISLRQIANATKISVAALESLERNDISRLPGGIFSRAFVRSYAIEVGLDPEETIQEFIAQFPHDSVIAGHQEADPVEDNQAIESDRQMASAFLKLGLLSIPIAGVVLYFGTAGRTVRPATNTAPAAVSSTASETPRAGDVQPSAAVEAPPPAETASSASGAAAPGALSPGSERSASAAAPPGQEAAEAPAAATLAIVIATTKPCWVSATVDGQKAVARLFEAGEQQTFDVKRELVLTAGDASALTVTVNGAETRPLGRAGEVVTARINQGNFRTYLAGR
jgi:cytoskeletal protein RodZ